MKESLGDIKSGPLKIQHLVAALLKNQVIDWTIKSDDHTFYRGTFFKGTQT